MFCRQACQTAVVTVIQNWLRNRVAVWPLPVVEYHARLVDRFLDRMVLTKRFQATRLANSAGDPCTTSNEKSATCS